MAATKYEYYNTGDDYNFNTYGVYLGCQTFTVGTVGADENHDITSVKLELARVGSPGEIYVYIRAVDGAGKPTGGNLSSGSYDGDTISISAEWIEISMSSYELQASTQYAVILDVGNGNSSNRIDWRSDSSSPTYTGGQAGQYSGAVWNMFSGYDNMFEVWGEAPSENINPKVKIAGTFATKVTKVKIGGSFAEKPVMVKVGGAFQ